MVRQSGNTLFTPVHTFMAHHQGMTIVALANVLRGNVARRWGMANRRIEAVVSLLHERTPREIPLLEIAPPTLPGSADGKPALHPAMRWRPTSAVAKCRWLSNLGPPTLNASGVYDSAPTLVQPTREPHANQN